MAITVTVTPPNETSITVGSGNAITVDIVQGTNRVVTATTSTPTAVTYRSLVSGGTGVTYSGSDGVINIGQDVATTATPSFAAMTIDSITINGTTIGHTSDTDLLTFASNQLTVAGEIEATALDINGNGDVSGTLTAGTFSGSLPTSDLTGTITNAQLAGSIANDKLANSTVSFGGISLALGASDATPAFDLSDATNYPTSSLSGTITNAQLAGSIANDKLANSTVSFGGVSLALGASDATPAFNLSDATNYPTSSLSGTITNAQLDGSIANSKLSNSTVSLGGVSVALGASDATPAFDLSDATNVPAAQLSGAIANGVTATTQSASDNSTKVATTAYTDTAIANLVDSSPSALNTLNELAAAINDDASFSTTVTNSIATKLPLAGGEMTGNITFSSTQTVDGRDLSVDGAKLDGIEANATADQTAAEIRTLVESASDSNVFTDADHTKLNAIEASADVTDATNVAAAGALMDSELTDLAGVKALDTSTLQVKPSEGAFANGDKTKLDGIEASADVTDTANVTSAGALMDSELTDLAGIKSLDTSTLQVKPSEGAFANGDKTKLDGIEASADVTDTANVTAAGALMDSEVTNLAQVKAFDSSDYAPAAGSSNIVTVGTLTSALTINTSSTASDLILTNSESSTNDASPILELNRNHGSDGVADGGDIGKIEFYGTNQRGVMVGGPEKTLFGSMFTQVVDGSDGTEDGQIKFTTMKAGTSTDTLTLNASGSTLDSSLTVNSDFMELISTTDNTEDMPILSLYRNAGAGVTNDELGGIRFFGQNNSNQKCFYAGIYTEARGVDDAGRQKGSLRFHVADGNGAGVNISDVTADIAGDEDPTMTLTSSLITVKNPLFIDEETASLQIADISGSLTANLQARQTIGNTELGTSSADSTVALPDCQSVNNSATLSAGFLFGNNLQSDKTTMSETEVCSMRGSGLFIYNDADGITVDLPAVSFTKSATTLKPGDEIKFVSFLGTITFDVDASGTAQTVYKIGNTTNGTAATAQNSGNFTLPAGGYMTLRAAFTNIYIITEHCGVAGI